MPSKDKEGLYMDLVDDLYLIFFNLLVLTLY